METKQEGSNKNDKEEHIAFDQGDYIKSMNEKLISALLSTEGACSALSDLYIYYYFKHELSDSTPKKYKDFIEYLNKKLGYGLTKLENVAKFINVIQSINNSIHDINGNAETVMYIQHNDNKEFYQDLQKVLDKHKCLKLSFYSHSIVIVKYGYFNASEREAKNVSYELLAKYVEEKIQKHKLHTIYGNQVLCIHSGKERIEAIFKDKEGKKALRQLFDDTSPYTTHLDKLKTANDMVKDHVGKTQARVEKFKEGEMIHNNVVEAQERNTSYEQYKAKLATFVTDNKTGEFDLTSYGTPKVILILQEIIQKKNLSVKKIVLNEWQNLNAQNIDLLEKIIKANKDIILELDENIYNQEQALTLIRDINVYYRKYPTKTVQDIASNVIGASNILSKQSAEIIFNANYSEVLLDFLMDNLSKEKKVESLDIHKRMNQQEYKILTKIVKEKNIETIYFYKDFQCNEELKEAIIENKNIKAIKLWHIEKINEQSIDTLKDILIKNSSITKVDLSFNNNITSDMFTSLFESISKNNNITSLMLGSNNFDDKTVAKLIEMIKANNIKELNIENIKISDQAAEKFFEALKENNSITNVDIADIQISDQAAKKLFEALKENTSIIHLNIARIKNISNQQIGKLLEKNHYSSIRIGNSDFRDGKGNPVFNAIDENKALKHLEVSWCEFDDQAKDEFIKALKANTSIKSIEIYGDDDEFNKQVEDIITERNEKPTPITNQVSVSNKNNEIKI